MPTRDLFRAHDEAGDIRAVAGVAVLTLLIIKRSQTLAEAHETGRVDGPLRAH